MERPHVEHIINTLGLKRVYSFPDIVHTLRGASGRSIDATLGELQRIGTVSDCPPTGMVECVCLEFAWVLIWVDVGCFWFFFVFWVRCVGWWCLGYLCWCGLVAQVGGVN